jgi:hypothetical protein
MSPDSAESQTEVHQHDLLSVDPEWMERVGDNRLANEYGVW